MGHHCGRITEAWTRREMLARTANGFGALALSALLADPKSAFADQTGQRGVHFAPRARNVIFLYMDGGPSQVDTFDYKPMLEKHHGQNPSRVIGKVEKTQFDNNGTVMRCPWTFRRRGESGLWVSDLFPHIGGCIDDLCVVRSMTSNFSEHTAANYFLHTGSGSQGRPSMGAWVSYGLGSDNQNLPGFIVLNGGLIPVGGLDNFNSGFLPASYQGSLFRPGDPPVANLRRLEATPALQKRKADFVKALDGLARSTPGYDEQFESAVKNYELSENMEAVAPETMDLSKESDATKELYGIDSKVPATATYARQCLVARRMIERGVRFIELTCPVLQGHDRWDQHGNLRKGHEDNARAVDQPIGALIRDLKARGLLDQTLILWAGEFGRTPFAQGADGRDHNPYGFTVWMAGGGVKPGFAYGETDEWGYKVVKDKLEMHDLHATILHLLGVDHKRQTFRFGGRDMRLTDVHGEVVRDLLA
ncbi:MAG TPA: DUF1501 domain-containing protein [Planctomycetota bacterium]|jgi:hypothetical protein|nr:DUF1501 domain-containing protein [Planctomycetota bacterium]